MTKCAVMSGTSIRTDNHYTLEIGDDISDDIPRRDAVTAANVLNREIERLIEKEPSQWMWLHKRFKNVARRFRRDESIRIKVVFNSKLFLNIKKPR